MKKFTITCLALLTSTLSFADNITDADEFLCAARHAQICFETGDCFTTTPGELSIPDFVVVNAKNKTVSTTKGGQQLRSSRFATVARDEGAIYLQGHESGRSFSFVINEHSGYVTVAIVRDGLTVNLFGACTDADA